MAFVCRSDRMLIGGELVESLGGEWSTSVNPATPPNLMGLTSFSLRAGLPEFTVGRIELQETLGDGTVRWSLVGEPDSLYLVERATNGFTWRPWLVLTNQTGGATFEDPGADPGDAQFYRARILD